MLAVRVDRLLNTKDGLTQRANEASSVSLRESGVLRLDSLIVGVYSHQALGRTTIFLPNARFNHTPDCGSPFVITGVDSIIATLDTISVLI